MMFRWWPGLDISMTPLRKVVSRSSSVNNGWHRTTKHPAGFIGAESRPELALFLVLAEMDPNVTAIAAQPTKVDFELDGKSCRHFPDFAVIEAEASRIYEVKTARKYADEAIRRRLSAAARSIEARGWSYDVALDTDMRNDPRFRHVEALWRRHRPIYDKLQQFAVEQAVGTGERRVADVVADLTQLGDKAPRTEHVLSLAANGKVFIDLTAPIGPASLIRRADRSALPEPLLPKRRPADDLQWADAA
ncbi:TnsA endonuclease N-terminal domain-containing protein [Sphingomonas sp.]|jgi:hypothetical protein|uniref:TnsA endonuclease N-terminal domain-containing protein n=1 Tax=Sphingomonas sp. TaxID=28214 RepID=UPI002DF33CA2|nr:TnsA endonuclease N-terminal domain-containing protein [Sphingomonas sp.]